ncbi:expressed unknown protein [Seminavis robusta]|uniref:Potassium channel tetramerisation-type BTB domain-containing protein n=1 Tax=Seminavis robusta TaxID=568900 RepID=A0A9N8HVB9_9STRA|nr:expressed unknown protein [Seminavis robusta]|eukprot:Sro1916_g305220.1 n/a (217) ;mRNA; f:11807-12457
MLARVASKEWEEAGGRAGEPVFIDRDGGLFRYVLNYMRTLQVNIPMTESKQALLNELEYYGFENVESESIVSGTIVEARRLLESLTGNYHFKLDDFDASIADVERKMKAQIKELETRKCAFKIAFSLFSRWKASGVAKVRFTRDTDDWKTLEKCCDWEGKFTCRDLSFIQEYLQDYGLKVISFNFEGGRKGRKYKSTFCDVALDHIRGSTSTINTN